MVAAETVVSVPDPGTERTAGGAVLGVGGTACGGPYPRNTAFSGSYGLSATIRAGLSSPISRTRHSRPTAACPVLTYPSLSHRSEERSVGKECVGTCRTRESL